MSTAVASYSQRNQATLPGHLIFIPVFKFFNRLAKASGFCLYFYSLYRWTGFCCFVMPDLIGHLLFIHTKEIPTLVAMRTKQQVVKCCPPAYAGMTIKRASLIHKFNTAYASKL